MLFREPNRIAAKILRNASVRPEESAPLLSRATNLADAYLPGENKITSILEAHHQSTFAKSCKPAEPVPHRSGSPRLTFGIRYGRSRGIEFRIRTIHRRGHDSALFRAAKLSAPNTPPTQRHAVPRAEPQHCLDLRRSSCEARGIGSAALKGYQSGGRIPAGSKQIALNLEARC